MRGRSNINTNALFQSAAGIYKHIKETVCESFQQDLTPDLNTEVLSSLTYLMLAQAQEIFVLKAIHVKCQRRRNEFVNTMLTSLFCSRSNEGRSHRETVRSVCGILSRYRKTDAERKSGRISEPIVSIAGAFLY